MHKFFVNSLMLQSAKPRKVYFVEALEPRTLLAVDFHLAAVLALGSNLAFADKDNPIIEAFRNAHGPKIKFDPAITEEINQGEEDPPEIQFDSTVVTGPAAPTLAGTIEAINFDQQASSSGFYNIPPDSSAAAGPTQLVNVVNTDIQWFTKAGTLQNTQRLGNNGSTATGSFFAALSPLTGTFDPKVVYDQYNGRFVVVSLERTDTADGDPSNTSRLFIAVSDDSDPNGTWYTRSINTQMTISGQSRWMDYPDLAVDANAVYVTGNMFGFAGGGFAGSRLWIISKSGLYTGGAPTSAVVYDPSTAAGLSSQNFSMQPTMMYGTTPGTTGTFLVSSGWSNNINGHDSLSVIRVSSPLSSPTFTNTFVDAGDIHQNGVTFPGSVSQSGTTNKINADDTRVYSAVWRNNTIWAANTINPVSGTDAGTPTAHWYKITADSATIGASPADQGNITGEDIAANTATFYPAITVDSSNNMGIGFSASGPNIFPGAYYTGRLSTDAAGTVQPAATLAAGVASYFRTFSPSGGVSRWGDYSGIAIDPSDSTTFWLYNEYAMAKGTVLSQLPNEDGRWATRYGKFTFVNPVSATPTTPDLVDTGNPSTTSDTGVSGTDNITKRDNSSASSTLQFSVGNTVSGATVVVFADGTQIGSAVAAGATTTVTTSGAFDLTDGSHNITAKQTENGKTVSLTSAGLSIMVDTVAPTVATPDFQFEVAPQRLIYKFSEDVSASLSAGDVAVTSVPAGTTPTLSAPTWDAVNKAATFNFSATPLPNNNYQATMAASGVTDVAGNPLPGNAVLSFFALQGDGTRSKQVEINDFNIIAVNFGKTGLTWTQGNYDYSSDGLVNITDFNVLATNFGSSLP